MTKISTDTNPDPAFYQTSVADALAANKPFVLVFATPKFCQTKTCGPTLDKVKAVAAKHPDVTFINVEPYLLEDVDGQLQPKLDAKGNLQAAPATIAYGLADRAVRLRRRWRRQGQVVVRADLHARGDRRRADRHQLALAAAATTSGADRSKPLKIIHSPMSASQANMNRPPTPCHALPATVSPSTMPITEER